MNCFETAVPLNSMFGGMLSITKKSQIVVDIITGFRPRATSPFCFGKRDQNHFCLCAALRVPPPSSRIRWLRNSLCSNSLRREVDSGRRLRRAQRRKPREELTDRIRDADGLGAAHQFFVCHPRHLLLGIQVFLLSFRLLGEICRSEM